MRFQAFESPVQSLELKNLSIQFNKAHRVINQCNLHLEAGKSYLLTGTTGSGKSTLLRFLKGIVPLFYPATISGEIRLNGEKITLNQLWTLRSHFGFLFQDPQLQVIGTTVIQDLAFGLENLAIPSTEIHEKIAQFASDLNIVHLLERTVTDLSGGELSISALCSILLLNPQILLLDEFTAFLDYFSRQQVLKLIQRSKSPTRIIVSVSHNLHEFLPIVDEVIMMDQGNIVFQGSKKHFIEEFIPLIDPKLRINELQRIGLSLCRHYKLNPQFNSPEELYNLLREELSG